MAGTMAPDPVSRTGVVSAFRREGSNLTHEQKAGFDRPIVEHAADPGSAIPGDGVRRDLTGGA